MVLVSDDLVLHGLGEGAHAQHAYDPAVVADGDAELYLLGAGLAGGAAPADGGDAGLLHKEVPSALDTLAEGGALGGEVTHLLLHVAGAHQTLQTGIHDGDVQIQHGGQGVGQIFQLRYDQI